jgi:hypothetical protein
MAAATAIDYAPIIAPILGLAVLLAAQYYLGRVPDLWRLRRAVLPAIASLDHRLIPSKTTLRLQPRERVGVIDAPPSVVRAELRDRQRVWPCNLASLQWDRRVDGVKTQVFVGGAVSPLYELTDTARETGQPLAQSGAENFARPVEFRLSNTTNDAQNVGASWSYTIEQTRA